MPDRYATREELADLTGERVTLHMLGPFKRRHTGTLLGTGPSGLTISQGMGRANHRWNQIEKVQVHV